MSGSAASSGDARRGSRPGGSLARFPVDVWERWLPAFHALCLGTIVATTALAVASNPIDPWRTPVALALATAMFVGYWVMFIRRRPWTCSRRLGAAYAIGLVASFAALTQITPYFAYLEFSVIPQLFFLLYGYLLVAVVGALGLFVALALSEFAMAGWRLGPAVPGIANDALTVAFAFALAQWIGAIVRQSVARQRLVDELTETRRELAEAERQAGVQEERARLAREIHDTLAQGFASVVAHLEAATGSLDSDLGRATHHVAEAEAVARASLGEARGLAWALRPETLAGGGLPGAIERAAAAAALGGPATDVTVTGTVRELPPDVEVTLLRAAQEALANVRRHARARHVTVTLSYFSDEVTLDIADDGRGFDPAATVPGPGGGLGLPGMRERVAVLGGRVAVESAPGEGTTIGVNLPVPAAALESPVEVTTG